MLNGDLWQMIIEFSGATTIEWMGKFYWQTALSYPRMQSRHHWGWPWYEGSHGSRSYCPAQRRGVEVVDI